MLAINKQEYQAFLAARIFSQIDYDSIQDLLDDIRTAAAIDSTTAWRQQKHAFNQIAMKAPMLDDSPYLLRYDEVPLFLEHETDCFFSTFESPQKSESRMALY